MTDIIRELSGLVRERSVLLVDFDGPICSLFAGYPASQVAEELRRLKEVNSRDLRDEHDPLRLLYRVSRDAPKEVVRFVADALRDKEVVAAGSATSTRASLDLLQTIRDSGRRCAVVSNNSDAALTAYLVRENSIGLFDQITGRYDGMDPSLLKPDPHLLIRTLGVLKVPAEDAIFIGDSISDVVAGHACGVQTIGFANRAAKRESLADAGAAVVVEDLGMVARALQANPMAGKEHAGRQPTSS